MSQLEFGFMYFGHETGGFKLTPADVCCSLDQ